MIVAEGAKFPDQGPLTLGDHPDPFGNLRLGGIGGVIADAIEKQTGLETRCVGPGPPPARRAAQRLRPHPGHPPGTRRQPAGPPESLRHHGHLDGGQDRGIRHEPEFVATKTLDLTYYDEAAAFFR